MIGRTGLILMLAFNAFVFTKAYLVTKPGVGVIEVCQYECNPDGSCESVGKSTAWGVKCPGGSCSEVLYIYSVLFFL